MVGLSLSGGARRVECGSPPDPVSPNGVWEGKSDQGLRLPERLRRQAEFNRVYKEGTSLAGSLLVLFVLASSELSRKAGFVAGRKVGNAVARNRAKRLLREAYRHHKKSIPETGYHLVFVARHGCDQAAYQDVVQELRRLLQETGFTPDKDDHEEGQDEG